MTKSGIYKIVNKVNGEFYIGSAIYLKKRWKYHLWNLKKNCHPNQHLQNSYNKYGEQFFHFEVLEFCPKELLLDREQHYLDNLNPFYNIRKDASSNLGLRWSTEKTRLYGQRRRGIKRPDVSFKNLGNTYASVASFSTERRKNISECIRRTVSKPVACLNISGEVISYHNSSTEAAKFYKIGKTTISRSCNNNTVVKKLNYYFKYEKR